ncbi:MAG: aldehyde dehydrogenase family protein, partial [Chloroflexi bacterium]
MTKIDEREVQAIIQRVRERLGEGVPTPPAPTVPRPGARPSRAASVGPGDGIFPTIDEAVAAARTAFQQYRDLGLEIRRAVIESIRRSMREHAQHLARLAHDETGLGRYPDKVAKNLLVTNKTPGPEDLEPTVWTGDAGTTITEYAPWGVIASITPTTNPTSTIINNTISILSAGNAVVFNVHPNAKRVSVENIRLINQAIVAAGGPPNLVTAIPEPTIESAQQLMRHPDVPVLLVTGGPAVVREALATDKRAITAGPGNPPVVVDETADIEKAGRDIVFGASFDNNIICTDEKEVFVVATVADEL